jgi:hypothetical protein
VVEETTEGRSEEDWRRWRKRRRRSVIGCGVLLQSRV